MAQIENGPLDMQRRESQTRGPAHPSRSSTPTTTAPEITEWKAYSSNTLQGIFSCLLPSGLLLHGLTLHVTDDGREWVGMPSKIRVVHGEVATYLGRPVYEKIVEIPDRARRDAFQASVLAALREHPQAGKCWEGGR